MKVRVVGYGALGNQHFPLYNPDIADAITSQGRYSIQSTNAHVIKTVNAKYPFVNMVRSLSDTDSFHLSVKGLVDEYRKSAPDASKSQITEMVMKFESKVIAPAINEMTKQNFEWLNDKQLTMSMDAEGVGDTEVITGKKRYAIRLLSVDGHILAHPKYKITGLEIKRSSTPALMRKKLDETLRLLFDGNNIECIKFMEDFEKEYLAGKYTLEEIAFPTGISEMDKFEGGNLSIPIHVRASMLHNKIVKEQGMKDLSAICAGDKIKWVYLKQNKFGSDVIAFNDKDFLKRIKIADKVDLKLMFEKTYLSPLEKLIEAVGWKMNNQALIMDSLF